MRGSIGKEEGTTVAMVDLSTIEVQRLVRRGQKSGAMGGRHGQRCRMGKSAADSKELTGLVDLLSTDAKGFTAATAEALQLEAVKKDLVDNQTLPRANRAVELMRTALDTSEKLAAEAKELAAADLIQANRVALAAAIAVIVSLIGSDIFTFFGVARPLTGLNGALTKLAGGGLNVVIPGSSRGDEVGDIAKTVVVIGRNAEQKAREEAEATASFGEAALETRARECGWSALQISTARRCITNSASRPSVTGESR